MALVKKRGQSWYVQWKELVVTRDERGEDHRAWKVRGRSFPDEKSARLFSHEVAVAAARGERFVDKREAPIVTIRAAGLAYVKAGVDAHIPLPTQRYRSALVGSFLDFVGEERLASDLSLTLLEAYALSLPSEGRKAVTQYRKVLAAEQLWSWAHDRPEAYPGVPPPRRYTGGSAEADKLRAPPPVIAVAAPTFKDVDAMIGKLELPWHRRIALLLRYTGLRASQACGLDWKDVDLVRGVLRVRSAVRGAKKGRARVLPLHPALALEMASWGAREGLLFPRRYKKDGVAHVGPYRADILVEPFRRAWTEAKIPVERWDVPADEAGERAKGSPTHAFRRMLRTELLRAGVQEAVVLYLIGQAQGITAAAYVPETSPEESPYWPRLRDGVATIPPHGAASRA